jgi:hypothetical protein
MQLLKNLTDHLKNLSLKCWNTATKITEASKQKILPNGHTNYTIVSVLCKLFPYKEIGWKDIGETFYRWTLLRTPWFKVYLHHLDCVNWHAKCHDHPWDFLAIILWGGYWEEIHNLPYKNIGKRCGGNVFWRRVGSILYRPAFSAHSVATQVGWPNWSLVIVGNKKRDWGFFKCGDGSEYVPGVVSSSSTISLSH